MTNLPSNDHLWRVQPNLHPSLEQNLFFIHSEKHGLLKTLENRYLCRSTFRIPAVKLFIAQAFLETLNMQRATLLQITVEHEDESS